MKSNFNKIILLAAFLIFILPAKSQDESLNFSFGHTKPITTIAISNTGKYVATAATDKSIKLWDVKTGKEIATFLNAKSNTSKICFDANDTRIFVGLITGEIIELDIEKKNLLQTFNPNLLKEVKAIDVSNDGKVLAAGYNNALKVWSVETGALVYYAENLSSEVKTVKFSIENSNQIIYALNYASSVFSVNLETEPVVESKLGDIYGIINDIEFISADKIFLANNKGETILYSLNEGKAKETIKDIYDTPISTIKYFPNTNILATGSIENELRVWDLDSSKVIISREGGKSSIVDVGFASNGNDVVFVSENGTINVWNINQMHKFRIYKTTGITNEINTLAVSNDLSFITAAYNDNKVRIWNTKSQEFKIAENIKGEITKIEFAKNNQLLFISSKESEYNNETYQLEDFIRVYEYNLFSGANTLKIENSSIFEMSFVGDESYIVVLKSGEIKDGNISENVNLNTINLTENNVSATAISKSKESLVIAKSNTIEKIELKTKKTIVVEVDEQISKLIFADDDNLIIAFTNYSNCKIFNAHDLKEIKQISIDLQSFDELSLVSDNELFIYDKQKNKRYLFNTKSFMLTEVVNLNRTTHFVKANNYLFSASFDGEVEVLNSNFEKKASLVSLTKKGWCIIDSNSNYSVSPDSMSLISFMNKSKTKREIESHKKENILSLIFE